MQNENNNKTYLLLYVLVLIFLLFCVKPVFASSSLTELNEEYPDAQSVIDDNLEYPYYMCVNLDINEEKNRFIILTDKVLTFDDSVFINPDNTTTSFGFYFSESAYVKFYQYDFNNSVWVNYNSQSWILEQPFVIWGTGRDVTIDDIDYVSFDIKTKNGTVVFRQARYLPMLITGQISSKNIWTILKKTINGLPALVIGSVVLVTAFRKGWIMLKTHLQVG